MPRVLFIDDDYPSLMIFKEICQQQGIEYAGIQNPIDTVNYDWAKTPDLIFIDMDMPVMNGYQTLEVLQALPLLQNVPFIACTVYTEQIQKAQAAGFSSFIAKPIKLETFPGLLGKLLAGQIIWET